MLCMDISDGVIFISGWNESNNDTWSSYMPSYAYVTWKSKSIPSVWFVGRLQEYPEKVIGSKIKAIKLFECHTSAFMPCPWTIIEFSK
mgnify:CR=1 FL=1